MKEFSLPSSYYNPPEYHEVCECGKCHLADGHDLEDAKFWAKHGCGFCYDLLNK